MPHEKSRLASIVMIVALVGIAVAGFFLLRDLKGPSISLSPNETGRVGATQNMTLTLTDQAGIRAVQITIRRGAESFTLLRHEFDHLQTEQKVNFNLREAKLPDGAFELEVKASDASFAGFGRGNSTTLSLPLRMDTQAPRIAVKTTPPNIRRGGSAIILYTVNEEVGRTGVKVGDYFFPGYNQQNGAYACLFPYPHFMNSNNFAPEIMAEDLAGNTTSSRLLVTPQTRNFREDTMNITDAFLNSKSVELESICPDEPSVLEQYICVNSKVRLDNDAFILSLAGDTSPIFLWKGSFKQLPRGKTMADFGDHRTYKYAGEVIDKQVHTGLDLASVAQSEIPATTSGRVIFAGNLGIYGNMVIIDHGLSLMSLYSHMTEISVSPGEEVVSEQILGTTGTSGLAGGDHLHYGILVGGIPVQPREWLDAEWIKNNITSRLNTPIQ